MATVEVEDGSPDSTASMRARMEANTLQLKSRVADLTGEMEALRANRHKASGEAESFAAYAALELKRKDEIMNDMRDRMRELEFERESTVRKLRSEMESALRKVVSAAEAVEAELRDKLRSAESKLERAQQYLLRRDELDVKIDVLQATLDTERAAHKTAFQDLERKYLVDKAALLKQHQAEFQELRRQARAEAQRSLDADTKRILLENKQMGEELKLTAEERKVLTKERAAMAEQARVLAREVELYADKEREWARQGSRKTQENRALLAKVAELETALVAERRDAAAKEEAVKAQAKAEVMAWKSECDGLRSALKAREGEVAMLARSGQAMLRQRNDVERFFLYALEEVKAQVTKRKRAAAMAAGGGGVGPGATGSKRGGSPRTGRELQQQQPREGSDAGRAAEKASLLARGLTMLSTTMPPPLRHMPAPTPLRSVAGDILRQAGGMGSTSSPTTHARGSGSLPPTATPAPTLHHAAPSTTATPGPQRDIPLTISTLSRVPASYLPSRPDLPSPIDIADLTTEDRYMVLRLLFAQINQSDAGAPPPRDADGGGGGSAALRAPPPPPPTCPPAPHPTTSMAGPFGLTGDIPAALAEMTLDGGGGRGGDDAAGAEEVTGEAVADPTSLAEAMAHAATERTHLAAHFRADVVPATAHA